MALDRFGQIYGWGESKLGCLATIDSKGRVQPTQIPFFENKRVIDVNCGELFTVVIAEVEGDPRAIIQKEYDENGRIKKSAKFEFQERINRSRRDNDPNKLESNRKPLCGGAFIS